MTWETVPLGKIAWLNPRADSLTERATFLGMADLSENGMTLAGVPLESTDIRPGYTPFRDRDLLFAKITPCFENGKIGQAVLPTKLGWGSTEFHVVRPDAECVDERYLLQYLRSPLVRARGIARMTGSAGQKRVPVAFLQSLPVPLPPLPEQRRIAAILDEADALRTVRATQQAQSMTMIEAEIQRVLASTESSIPFHSLTSEPFRNGISPSRVGKVEAEVLTLSAITRGGFDPGARKHDTFAAPHSGDKLVREGLHLICRGNGNADLVGVMAVATAGLESVAFPDTMIATRPSAAISSAALAAAWRSDAVREQIRRGARTTNGTYKINQQLLGSIEVPVPSADQQLRIGELDEEKLSFTRLLDTSLARADELFASLQHRAFRGEL